MGNISFFLGIKFIWRQSKTNLSFHLSQPDLIETILDNFCFDPDKTTIRNTPYQSGYPVDSIKHEDMPDSQRK